MGLVNVVVPLVELNATVRACCDETLQYSPTVLKVLKASIDAECDYARDVLFHDQRMMAPDFWGSAEAKEGRAAFLEKRKPDFRQCRRAAAEVEP